MKVDKMVNGEVFRFYVYPNLNNMTATVKEYTCKDGIICKVSKDFKYILLPENFTKWQAGLGSINIKKLKLNKCQQREFKEYNN